MIAELVAYLKTKTELTDITDKIVYRKPIKDIQPENYIYLSYRKQRIRNWYKYSLQFNIFWEDVTNLETLADNLECLLVGGSRVPSDLKQELPKLRKTLLISTVPFSDELTTVANYEFYYNF